MEKSDEIVFILLLIKKMDDKKTIIGLVVILVLTGSIGLYFNYRNKRQYIEIYKEQQEIQNICQPYMEYKRIQTQTKISRYYTNYLERRRATKQENLFKSLNQ